MYPENRSWMPDLRSGIQFFVGFSLENGVIILTLDVQNEQLNLLNYAYSFIGVWQDGEND